MSDSANPLKFGRDLTKLAANAKLNKPLHRQSLIDQVLESLDRKRSVILLGPEGVGKTAVIQGIACAFSDEKAKRKKRKLVELSSADAMTGTKYLGEWESKAGKLIERATSSQTILYYSDIWNLPFTGKSSGNPSNLFDFYKPNMNEQGLLLIGEMTPEIHANALQINGFLSMFTIIPVEPLSTIEIKGILQERSENQGLHLSTASLDRIHEVCNQFLASSAGPRPPLQLMDRLKHYQEEKALIGEPEEATPAFVEKVFSIYSGLPLFVIDTKQTLKVNEIRAWFRERVIGQERAVEAVVQSIVMFKAAINDPSKPLGAFMFVGPTGVGKTELAKALAVYLFGSERRLLRFDLSEFSDYNSFKLLIGDAEKYNAPARLTDPILQQPFQVVLFDELEKGHLNIRDLLLQILDEGRLSNASGKAVNFRNTFIIVTSNVGADQANRQPMGFAEDKTGLMSIDKLREGLEAFFRPEFLNRFQQIVPFNALQKEHVERIVRKEVALVMGRRGISARNLAVDFTDSLIDHVSDQGYDARYGARALKREIEQQIVMPIATLLAEQNPAPGSLLKLDYKKHDKTGSSSSHSTSVRVLSTEQSLTHERNTKPTKSSDGSSHNYQSLLNEMKTTHGRIEAIQSNLNKTGFPKKLHSLEKQRQDPSLWSDIHNANSVIVELDQLHRAGDRIEVLNDSLVHCQQSLIPDCSRQTLSYVANELVSINQQITTANRELIILGQDQLNDAIVELTPMGSAKEFRESLFNLYTTWAHWRGFSVEMLHEPLADNEPIMICIKGEYASGYLNLENGVHSFRDNGARAGAIRVRISPWLPTQCKPVFESRVALKKTGQLGGKIRSRAQVLQPGKMVLQNANTLEENREVAIMYTDSWANRVADVDENVRRYDDNPFLVKDYMTSKTFNRRNWAKPDQFHELLCQRIDAFSSSQQ